MRHIRLSLFVLVATLGIPTLTVIGQVHIQSKISRYIPPRPAFTGFHVGLPKDSAFLLMSRLAVRRDTLHMDSVILLESDSVQIIGLPAYVQLQIVHGAVRTVVINWHPLAGEHYTNLRDWLIYSLEHAFGKGIAFTNGSLTYHRWETDDGTSEVSHSDKYMRVFLKLGKPRE